MAPKKEEENWTTIIKPRNSLFEVNLKEIWDYRDLLTLFVKRTITVQYKQTILGPLWWFIQPAFTGKNHIEEGDMKKWLSWSIRKHFKE